MKQRMYKVHKGFGVTVGVFILVWVISGIVMIVPPLSRGRLAGYRQNIVD